MSGSAGIWIPQYPIIHVDSDTENLASQTPSTAVHVHRVRASSVRNVPKWDYGTMLRWEMFPSDGTDRSDLESSHNAVLRRSQHIGFSFKTRCIKILSTILDQRDWAASIKPKKPRRSDAPSIKQIWSQLPVFTRCRNEWLVPATSKYR